MGKAAKTSTAGASAAAAVDVVIALTDGAVMVEPLAEQVAMPEGDAAAAEQAAGQASEQTVSGGETDADLGQAAALDEIAAAMAPAVVPVPGQMDAVTTSDPAIEQAEAQEGTIAIDHSPAAVPRTVRARVLAFCNLGAPDDVIEIDADQIALVGDVIDTDPAAVAYAESLKG